MIPSDFQQKYPEVARALSAMFSGAETTPGDASAQAGRKEELCKIVSRGEPVDEVFRAIWSEVQESQATFFEKGMNAYHQLGISDDVRAFMGQLWCCALRSWPVSAQHEFLLRIIDRKGFHLFEALDFSAPLFQHITLTPEFMMTWVTDARRAVGNDLYQRGLIACVENYARHQPIATLAMIRMAIAQRHDPQVRGVLARMLHLARGAVGSQDSPELNAIETALGSPGDAASRALLLESWALAAGSTTLSESRALALHRELCLGASEEQSTWCFLLAQVVSANKSAWPWAHRELGKLTGATLDSQARYWVLIASINGWAAADGSGLTREDWATLFFSFPSLNAADGGAWRHVEYVLTDSLPTHPAETRGFMIRLAETAGRAWRELMDDERGILASWSHALQTSGQASALVTELCLSSVRPARRVGIKLLGAIPGATLDATALAAATSTQLELLILQSSLQLGDHANTARLHASIATAVDRLGGEVAELFYDEALTQALNTNQYREALKGLAPDHAKIQSTLTEAHRQLDATIAAAKSPALQMQVPGRHRAESLATRRFGRQVAKGMDKFSFIKHIATTVQLLYGKVWRMQDAGGNLTDASALKLSSVSMEMPRLEFVTPDAMRLRRLAFARRIAELQQGAAEEEA